ncbi:MAG: hypothetical protein KAU62_07115 [Candidatus Heimdallarchaeota archaeon]|nr:hypothetical protein [Candidatus Heimdallarchaeota archaeon]MCG3255839.1 hypothetical protein [Candidatus Heimdallarchaeota archaeon]MCK4610911.1 hypothetical protein [Candidatus Heimdallarchaeota archaeon]
MVISLGRAIAKQSSNKSIAASMIKTQYPKIIINLEEEIEHLSSIDFSDSMNYPLVFKQWRNSTTQLENVPVAALNQLRWLDGLLFNFAIFPLCRYSENDVIAFRMFFRTNQLPSAMVLKIHAKTNDQGFYPENGDKITEMRLEPHGISYQDILIPAKTKTGRGFTTVLFATDDRSLLKLKFVFEFRERLPVIKNSQDVESSNYLGLVDLQYVAKDAINAVVDRIANRNDDHKLNQGLPYAFEMMFFTALLGIILLIAYAALGSYGYYAAIIIAFSISLAYTLIGNPGIRKLINRRKYVVK